MNRAVLQIAALALPLVGLGGMWLSADRLSRQGTEWDVPIQGYDPRDLLQGHYVQFQYDWPGPEAESGRAWSRLCLEGRPPRLDRATPIFDEQPGAAGSDCRYPVGSDQTGVGRAPQTFGGRLYASQDAALEMQRRLADPKMQGVVRVRLRPDGHITPLRITFRPRPPEPQATP